MLLPPGRRGSSRSGIRGDQLENCGGAYPVCNCPDEPGSSLLREPTSWLFPPPLKISSARYHAGYRSGRPGPDREKSSVHSFRTDPWKQFPAEVAPAASGSSHVSLWERRCHWPGRPVRESTHGAPPPQSPGDWKDDWKEESLGPPGLAGVLATRLIRHSRL